MKLLKYVDMKRMPWKNGLGMTTELAIEPEGTSFESGEMSWRLSCAEVAAVGPFSTFPGYSRILTVWKGAGLNLNGKKLNPFSVHQFEGEETIECEPLSDRVFDLGLIFNRTRIEASMQEISVAAGSAVVLKNDVDTLFLFCAAGEIDADGFHMSEGDIFRVDSADAFEIRSVIAESRAIGFVVRVRSITA